MRPSKENMKKRNKLWIRKYSIRKKYQKKSKVYNEFVYQNRKDAWYTFQNWDEVVPRSNSLYQNGHYLFGNREIETSSIPTFPEFI